MIEGEVSIDGVYIGQVIDFSIDALITHGGQEVIHPKGTFTIKGSLEPTSEYREFVDRVTRGPWR